MTIDKPLSVGISNFFIAAAGDSILIIFQLKQTPPEVYIYEHVMYVVNAIVSHTLFIYLTCFDCLLLANRQTAFHR